MTQDDDLTTGYRKIYKMRAVGEEGLNIIVSIPRQVIEREARKHGLTITDFLNSFRAVALYDGFEGIRYTFEPVISQIKNQGNSGVTLL